MEKVPADIFFMYYDPQNTGPLQEGYWRRIGQEHASLVYWR